MLGQPLMNMLPRYLNRSEFGRYGAAPPVPGGVSLDCEKYLIGLAERVALERPLHTEDQYFLRYSGHMTDELGLFKGCTLAPNMTYPSCQLGVEVVREALGVCLSNKC